MRSSSVFVSNFAAIASCRSWSSLDWFNNISSLRTRRSSIRFLRNRCCSNIRAAFAAFRMLGLFLDDEARESIDDEERFFFPDLFFVFELLSFGVAFVLRPLRRDLPSKSSSSSSSSSSYSDISSPCSDAASDESSSLPWSTPSSSSLSFPSSFPVSSASAAACLVRMSWMCVRTVSFCCLVSFIPPCFSTRALKICFMVNVSSSASPNTLFATSINSSSVSFLFSDVVAAASVVTVVSVTAVAVVRVVSGDGDEEVKSSVVDDVAAASLSLGNSVSLSFASSSFFLLFSSSSSFLSLLPVVVRSPSSSSSCCCCSCSCSCSSRPTKLKGEESSSSSASSSFSSSSSSTSLRLLRLLLPSLPLLPLL
mmetsp:Transcript_42017/g.101006  ORF Transcript_42017/g.101006 Transcript_42017/m.101006 type:complete len:367 (-) Transcript_42017:1494-2594(-)